MLIYSEVFNICSSKISEKVMAPHSSTLAWQTHGQRSLVGCRVGHDWSDLAVVVAAVKYMTTVSRTVGFTEIIIWKDFNLC